MEIEEAIETFKKDSKRVDTLRALADEDKLTAYGLGKALDITTASVKNRVDPLVDAGLVGVKEITAEGEVVKRYFSLTTTGAHMLDHVLKERREKDKEIRSALGSFRGLKGRLEEKQDKGGGGGG